VRLWELNWTRCSHPGVDANDAGDADNGRQSANFPVVQSSVTNGSSTIVTGRSTHAELTTFTIQFFANPSCDPSGNGEGQTFVGSINQTTGADGHFMFSATMMSNVAAGQFITTTATDSGNNTSEFSACVQVTGASPHADADTNSDSDSDSNATGKHAAVQPTVLQHL
jgi:hypothetical protein